MPRMWTVNADEVNNKIDKIKFETWNIPSLAGNQLELIEGIEK